MFKMIRNGMVNRVAMRCKAAYSLHVDVHRDRQDNIRIMNRAGNAMDGIQDIYDIMSQFIRAESSVWHLYILLKRRICL